MTTVIAFAASGIATAHPRVKRFFKKVSDAFEAFAESRASNAVPDWQLRRVRNDMKRFDRLMHTPVAGRRNRNTYAARRWGAQ